MLENLIKDVKLAAMDVVADVKEMAHDATTKLPDQVQKDFSQMDNRQLQAGAGTEYMGNGWGMMGATMTAYQIDATVDKMNFIANMIQNGLLSFDAIETELRAMASLPTPPSPAQLMSLAARIDASQKQTFNGLQELRNLTVQVDKATDKLQNGSQNAGWNMQPTTSIWK